MCVSMDIFSFNQCLCFYHVVEEIIIREEQNEDERQAQGKSHQMTNVDTNLNIGTSSISTPV